MKLKIKLYKFISLPDSKNTSTHWTFDVKRKKKLVHNGFISGPFFDSQKEARKFFKSGLWINIWMLQEKL